MHKNLITSFYLIFLTIALSVGQQKQITQLKKQLSNTEISDSLKIKYLGDLGWYYGNLNIDSSFYFTKKGLSLALKTTNLKGIGQSFNDLGIIYYRTSKYDSALVNYNKSLLVRKKLKDSVGIAGLYSKIGITYQQTSTLDSALFYNNKSIRIYEALNMERHVIINENNIANIYQNLNQFDKALSMHFKILKKRAKFKRPNELAESYVNIGNTYQKLQNFTKSKEYYDKAIPIAEKNNLVRMLSIAYNNYGAVFNEEGNMDAALKYYKKAYSIRKKLNDLYGLASVTGNLGVLYFEATKFKRAQSYLHESLILAKKINAKELELSAYSVLTLLKAYLKQPDSTVFYQKKHEELNNLIRNENITKQIVEIETEYETVKKEKEIAQQKEQLLAKELKLQNRNLYVILLTAAFLILGILSFGFYKRHQLKNRQLKKEIRLKEALSQIKTQNQLQEQRLRISRDLHDNIGSQLTFIISSIDNLKYITKEGNTKLKSKLSTISSFTSDTIFQLRDTIWAMNKSEITFEDLLTRILSFVEKAKTVSTKTTFEVQHTIKSPISFTSIIGINVFRVFQEAINNAIKYANASQIKIEIKKEKTQFTITISDNGKGFDIEKTALGNGLQNMEKRMNDINGQVTIKSHPEKGTNIRITLNT